MKQAVVVVREDQPGDPRLVAYYVTQPNMNVTADQLRDQVKQSLPAYMVPQYFVELTALPQTANGKIDRKLLPAPIAVRETPQLVTPRTESECLLAVLWQEALETSAIGVQDNFFNLGGHSLLVMRVIARVEESVGVRLSPQDFLLGTLEQIAKKLDATLPARTEPQATANESVDQSASSNATSPERSNPFGSKPQWWQKVWRC